MSYIVQSVLLRRDKFSKAEALKWIRDHDYKAGKIDMTNDYYRFRQVEPVDSVAVRYRTISLGDIGQLVVLYAGPEK